MRDAIILSFYMCLVNTNCQSPSLYIVPEKTSLLLTVGDSMSLDCIHVFEADSDYVATFSKNDIVIPMTNSKSFRIHVKKQVQESTSSGSSRITSSTTLKKMFMNVSDSGIYSCHVPDETTAISILVINVTTIGTALPVQTPDFLEVRCNISGVPGNSIIRNNDDIKWTWSFRDSTLQENEKYKIMNRNGGGSLRINNPDRSDIGEYRCLLTQRTNTQMENPKSDTQMENPTSDTQMENPTSVFVRASPFIDTHTLELHNTGLELTCKASGSPIPTIIWTKDGTKLNESINSYRLVEGNSVNSKMVLDDADGNNDGVYSCFAYNDIEPFNTSAQITVDAKERMSLISAIASGPVLKPSQLVLWASFTYVIFMFIRCC